MAQMTQDELDRRLAELGGGRLIHSAKAGTVKVQNPNYNKYDPNSQETVDLDVEQWRSPEGYVIQAAHLPDGSWSIVRDEAPAPKPQDAKTGPPGGKPYIDEEGPNGHRLGWNPETQQYDRDLGLSAAAQQPPTPQEQVAQQNAQTAGELNNERSWNLNHGGLYETHAERRTREAKEQQENAPKTTSQVVTRNGKTFIIAQTTDKSGTIQSTRVMDTAGNVVEGGLPNEEKEAKPGQIVRGGGPNGEDVQAVVDPKTGEISYRPITGARAPNTGIGLKNVDEFQPDFNSPDLGLSAWATKQRQKIGLPPEQGGITQTDYDNAVKAAHEQASVTITNITNKSGVERQRYIDEQTYGQRASDEAASDYGNALGIFNQVWKYADPKTGSIRNLIPGLMAEQARYRSERRSQVPPMPALHPMFQSVSQQTAATAQPPAAKENAPATGPEPSAYRPPIAPVTAGITATNAAAVNPTGPNVQAANDATMAGSNAAFGALGINPPPTPAPAPTPPPQPVFAPPPLEPGQSVVPPPSEPVGQMPNQVGPVTAFAQDALAPAAPPPAAPTVGEINPALATVAQQGTAPRAPEFDPFSNAGRLAALGFDPDILAQAMVQGGYVQPGMMQRRMA